jgi:hypothetical protein
VTPFDVAPRPWLWPNLLSLDAPLVALVWQALFARCFHADVNPLPAVLLVLSVWLIYAADRAFDAWGETGRLPRHEFYRRHWRVVLPIWTVVLTLASWLAWVRLPWPLFLRGLILLAGVAFYFGAVHLAPAAARRAWPKEAAVAILFALGVSLPAWNQARSPVDVLTILLFSSLCWINCIAIKQWEHREPAGWSIGAIAAGVAFAAIFLLHEHRPVLSGAEAASALAFVLLDRRRRHLSADALRVLADVALLSPVLFLPIAGVRI